MERDHEGRRRKALSERTESSAPSGATGWLERGLGSTWERLAPLSVGAVASGAVIVGAGVVLRALLGSRFRRVFGWAGAAAFLPIGYWWWTQRNAEQSESIDATDASSSDRAEELEATEAD